MFKVEAFNQINNYIIHGIRALLVLFSRIRGRDPDNLKRSALYQTFTKSKRFNKLINTRHYNIITVVFVYMLGMLAIQTYAYHVQTSD